MILQMVHGTRLNIDMATTVREHDYGLGHGKV